MSFWKRLFGLKESPEADDAERTSSPPDAASNPPSTATRSGPATPPHPAPAQSHAVTAQDPSVSFQAAVKVGDLEEVKALLKSGPDLVFDQDSTFGATPLYWAVVNGHREVAAWLLVLAFRK